MKVKDIIGECLIKMGGKNFLTAASLTEGEQELAERLLAALNIVYREAVTEYIPLIEEEEVEFKDGKLQASELKKPILYPVKLVKDGVKHKVKAYPTSLESDFSGRATLTYAYLPDAAALDGVIDDIRVTQGILSDGTLGEYYFQNKVFDLASGFDTDYRTALSALRYRGRELKLGGGRRSL